MVDYAIRRSSATKSRFVVEIVEEEIGRGEPIWQASAPARSTILKDTSSPESLFFYERLSRPARPPHQLGGVPRVAPYSSWRRPAGSPTRQRGNEPLLTRRGATPPALPQSVGH